MRCELRLAEVEKLTLEQLALNHRHRDIRTRATGLVLLSSGLTAPKVAARLGVTVQSPYDWVMAWRERGVVGLLTGHGGGRLRALPDTMVAAAIQIATTEPLALARIAQCLEATVNEPLPCRIETLGMALKREGRSFKRNRYALKKKARRRGIRNEADHAREAPAGGTARRRPAALSRRGGFLRFAPGSA